MSGPTKVFFCSELQGRWELASGIIYRQKQKMFEGEHKEHGAKLPRARTPGDGRLLRPKWRELGRAADSALNAAIYHLHVHVSVINVLRIWQQIYVSS